MTRSAAPRTWIFPNRNAIGLVAVLLGMGYAGLTQSNGAAYLLCFLLAGVALVSSAHAWANLRGIAVEAQAPHAVFAGQELEVKVAVRSARQRMHDGIGLTPLRAGSAAHFPIIRPEVLAEGRVRALAERRGCFASLPLRLESRYPLGFFTARTSIALAAPHYVYPAPRGERPLPVTRSASRAGTGGLRAEGDDFAGVRAWRVGESQRHIDWKAVSRGQPLVIKEWSGEPDTTVHLDWAVLGDLPREERLSQLARWIIDAERGGQLYALRLPDSQTVAARGEAHYHTCLRQLAEFPGEDGA